MRTLAGMKPKRYEAIDSLRGLAMVWMTAFHFAFDLNYFGLIQQNFYHDPLWTWQRTLIVSLFLFCAGLGQAVAVAQGQRWPRFWRRWAQVAGCALLVSVGSWLMFPKTFIYFGVLHGLAVMLIVARLSAGWGRGLWWAGAGALALYVIAPMMINASGEGLFLNEKLFNWLGLITRKPVTEDFVPLVPWLAAVWWGLAAGRWVLAHRPHWLSGGMHVQLVERLGAPHVAQNTVPPLTTVQTWTRWLALPGRWSLSYYMVHQPVLIGLLTAWTYWAR